MGNKQTQCGRSYSIRGRINNGSSFTEDTTSQFNIAWSNFRVGANNPNWKIDIARGLDATGTLNAAQRKVFVAPGYGRNDFFPVGSGYQEVIGPISAFSNEQFTTGIHDPNEALYQQALGLAEERFTKSFRKTQVAWHSGEFVGDLAKTVRSLLHPLKSLEKLTIDAGRGVRQIAEKMAKSSAPSRYLAAATDTWIAYQYGARPLVADIHDAHEALKRFQKATPFNMVRVVGNGVARAAVVNTSVPANSPGSVGDVFCFDESIVEEYHVRIIGGYKTENPNGEMPFWASLGLSPDNWAPTLYELFPFSFVADYFSNAGAVIDAVSVQLVGFAWLVQTNRYVRDYKTRNVRFKAEDYPGITGYAYGGNVIDGQKTVARHIRDNSFSPQFRVKLPGLGQDLNLVALYNVLRPK